jgi:hypothetical protein
MIEQSYGRFMRKDFLGPLIGPTSVESSRSGGCGKTGPQAGPSNGVTGKRPEFSRKSLVAVEGIEKFRTKRAR